MDAMDVSHFFEKVYSQICQVWSDLPESQFLNYIYQNKTVLSMHYINTLKKQGFDAHREEYVLL